MDQDYAEAVVWYRRAAEQRPCIGLLPFRLLLVRLTMVAAVACVGTRDTLSGDRGD